MSASQSSFVIISGGSACNHIARAFHKISSNNVCYVLGISDNGGSTSELLRVLGGPSIGDLRSRLTRLIDVGENAQSPERMAMKDLLSYRLPADASEEEVKDEWAAIVEGRHRLWNAIPIEKKEAIRGFLTSFNFEILKRAHKRFNFCNGSIGNFFLTGARLFFGSLEAALFLFSAITGISEPTTVVPVINTNHTATIAALLVNGETLVGQCEISHPSPSNHPRTPGCRRNLNPIDAFSHLDEDGDGEDDAAYFQDNNSNLVFSKHVDEKLVSPVQRIYYINTFGQEIYPVPNPKVISHLSSKRTLIYSIGSLYTSIVPCLILRNVGNTIVQSSSLKHKILMLNGSNDRETTDYTALDFIQTITAALNESQKIDARRAFYQSCDSELSSYVPISHPQAIPFQRSPLSSQCSSSIYSYDSVTTAPSTAVGSMPASPSHHYPPFPDHLFSPSPASAFITHLIYLHNSAIPVDTAAVERLGIQCVCIQGSITACGKPVYDEPLLTQAIERIVQ
ncbi:hypothetical protein DFQ28_001029 [Apophysomyces sp. BC1034]|nr:hypothetical protein DFQ30_000863 [Apophysomyces sp. BC1015]KAG0180905.1 hypothetical protein DFQ29_009914 [Apophysomyces sp. BC1021]KAG0191077.1 hypothetical protein DFQ28_001029 [Apophysomyces sp. BC1034]